MNGNSVAAKVLAGILVAGVLAAGGAAVRHEVKINVFEERFAQVVDDIRDIKVMLREMNGHRK